MNNHKLAKNTIPRTGLHAHKLLFDLHSEVSTIKQDQNLNPATGPLADNSKKRIATLLDKIETHVPLILFHDLQDTPVTLPIAAMTTDLSEYDPHEVALDALENTLIDLRDAFDMEPDPSKADRLAGKILRQEAKMELLRESWE